MRRTERWLVQAIKKSLSRGRTWRQIMEQFGVSKALVAAIARGDVE